MLTARSENGILRAEATLKGKNYVYRCLDEHCDSPEMELVIGRGIRTPYFRHKRKGQCSCSEGETEWHREWKSHFERIEYDMGVDPVTGEHNRADAVVGQNFVIEFQHSPISIEEQQNRERFYGEKGGMVWIVDANKKRLRKKIDEMIRNRDCMQIKNPPFDGKYFNITFPDEIFPKGWCRRPVGVIFDYGQDYDLIYLLPMHNSQAVLRAYKRDELIKALTKGCEQFARTAVQMEVEYQLQEQRKREAEEQEKNELNRKIHEAFIRAKKTPFPLLQPVEGTVLYVDANRNIYRRTNGNKLELVYIPSPRRLPTRRHPRL